MCTLTKHIHYICLSKPFIHDNTEGICGLESVHYTSCPAEATPQSQIEATQAKIIGNRWLVNTPVQRVTLTYDQHDTATCIILHSKTLWITVPMWSILHIDDLALYHHTDDDYRAELETSPFFKQHSFILDAEFEERIKEATYWFDSCWYSFWSFCSPSTSWRDNYSVRVCRWHSALHLYYYRICILNSVSYGDVVCVLCVCSRCLLFQCPLMFAMGTSLSKWGMCKTSSNRTK